MYLALRAAIQHGLVAVEELLGMRNPVVSTDVIQQAKSFVARTLSMANFVAKLGFLHQDLPIVKSARRLLSSLKLGRSLEQDRVGVDRVSVPMTLNEAITRIIGPAVPGANAAANGESGVTTRPVELKRAA